MLGFRLSGLFLCLFWVAGFEVQGLRIYDMKGSHGESHGKGMDMKLKLV